jgi:Bacterial Ig-like domain
MRRVDAEGDSRGVQGRKRTESRFRTRVRNANLEWLERRELLTTSLSNLPSSTVIDAPGSLAPANDTSISHTTAANNLTAAPSASAPSVAVDPLNTKDMIAVWINTDPNGFNAGNFVAPITSYAEGAFSTNGGTTWTAFPAADFGPNSVNVQTDFSITPPTNGTTNKFTQTTDASVAFDHSGNFYVLTSTHDAEAANGSSTAGVLDLQRYTLSGGVPNLQSARPVPVYSWDAPNSGSSSDPAVTPVLAVDSNLASFTDPTTGATQTDPFSGNVYVVWASVDSNSSNPGISSFNPNTIRMVTSDNEGVSFTPPAYVDNSSNGIGTYNEPVVTHPPSSSAPLHDSTARYAEPQVTISQGTSSGSVQGGQVTIVYDNFGTQAPLDEIVDQTNTVGGDSEQFTVTGTAASANIGIPISIPVDITSSNFTTLQSLTITAKIAWPNLSEIDAYVIPPTALNNFLEANVPGYTGEIVLFNRNIGAASGTADASANLGATSGSGTAFGAGSGTVFSTEAIRSIVDGSAGNSAVGEYQPLSVNVLTALQDMGLQPNAVGALPGLNGTWTFESDDLVTDTSTSPKFVAGVTLNFASGNDPGSTGAEVTIANKFTVVDIPIPGINTNDPAAVPAPDVNDGFGVGNGITSTGVSGSGNITAPVQEAPILPAPVIASDNTLGSFSEFEGTLYVAFTGMYSNSAADNTDILIFSSTDGGKTWSSGLQVNDDNSDTDGFSASGTVDLGGAATAEGRTQYDPQIAVDQSTGTVVLSFLDARNDPSDARVSTYIATSNDGGATFAPEVYANPTSRALDAITGDTVNLGPVPDNQSAAGGTQTAVGYGEHQSLIVINGEIIPFWSSNQNTSVALQIVDSILTLASGPRIIASTQGPVGQSGDTVNTSRAADGTPMANTIVITFDEPVAPTATATALLADTTVFFKSPDGGTSLELPILTAVPVASSVTEFGATEFEITFNPAAVLSTFGSFVGTYSYAIAPAGITDRIRHTNSTGTVVNGNEMDQSAESVLKGVKADYVVGQPTGFSTYATGTLPLIVPGPNLIGTAAINSAGTVISSGTNNLVLDTTVNALQLTFDRNIQVGSFTPAQILSIFGPAGAISTAGITITPLTVFSGDGQVPYVAGGLVADVFKVTFQTQELSGTYSVTIGTGIVAADGSGIDPNLDAGLDALKGTATNGVTIPVTFPSTAGSSAIPAGTVAVPGVLTSPPIVINDDFPIQGDVGSLAGLTLTLNIAYPVDPNLTAFLQVTTPTGAIFMIELFAGVGTGTNTANFSTTTFSDTASTLISNAGAPFFGTFKPQEPLANLATQDDLSSQGTWNLIIENTGTATGTLNSWSLTFQKPVSATGLGLDQTTTSFQIFNMDPSSALANSTWTAVGPAGVTTSDNGTGTFAGTLSTIAVDPADPSGNTVYVGSASGGIWKTTDFLTTSPAGPTYQPLTDFGPDFSLDIGSIAIFDVNDNPSQSVIFAGTGFGQEATTSSGGYSNVDLNSGAGVGILKSTDGGQTWTLLDSLNNTLPEASRDHTFVGTTTYKIVVDPTPEPDGDIIVYAALGGPKGGLYRSIDSGETWTLLSAGISNTATDIVLDPNSASSTTGNLQILYAAFPNMGVYQSSNEGQTLLPIAGGLGKNPLLVKAGIFPAPPVAVQNSVSPDVPSSYIVLAKPALVDSVSENLAYEGWLYAAVENPNGTFNGLYVTKDDGENWTLVQLGNLPGTNSIKNAVPTNTTTGTNSYDPTSSNLGFSQQGAYDLTLTVDPTNPNIVYLGGSSDFQQSGMIRVDLTNLFDSENFTSFSNEQTDGGQTTVNSQGAVNVAAPANGPAQYIPNVGVPESNILNLRYAPNNGGPGTSTFATNATLVAGNVGTGFVNNGTGVTWTLFDEPLLANAGDDSGSSNLHDVISYVDPLTGDVRMLFADDEGVFTALVQPDGTLSSGIGTAVEPNYSRNGNLQDEQYFDGAAEPSSAASEAAGALFFVSGQTTIAAQSAANILATGNLTYDNSAVLSPSPFSPLNTAANASIVTSDRRGVGIATDPGGTGTVDQFDIPILGGNLTDFFRVNSNGQTTGLANNVNAEFPNNGTRSSGTTGADVAGAVANGQILQGNFTVNPLNGQQILIASATENLYETTNEGIQWLPIGDAANFDGTTISSLAYGAPDPNAPDGIGNLDNFIYVGTTGSTGGKGGQIYVSEAGGSGWTNISSGLDGGSVVGIYPDPNRGSHAAYAVTLTGVFYSADTTGLANAGETVWTNITTNLTSMPNFAAFNSNSGTGNVATTQYGGFTSIVADYRYLIPASTNTTGGANNVFFPVLYVSGYGGVFDSINNGATWSQFPNTTFNNAPVNGGYLPTVDVTNLQLVLGDINPSTGHAVQTTGDPEILLASTFGRGEFAISLAPDVFPNTIVLDPTLPGPNGSDSGAVRGFPDFTNVLDPVIDGTSEVTNFGNTVTVNVFDDSGPTPVLIGTGVTNAFGQFQILVEAQGANSAAAFYDPAFLVDGLKTIGIQATDSAGAMGNVAVFTYNLKATPPANPTNLTLTNESARTGFNNVPNPKSNLLPPTFAVTTTEPATTEVELVRLALGSTTNYEVVDTVAAGTGTVDLTDTLLKSELNGALIDQTITYYAIQIDLANNFSTPLANITSDPTQLTILLDNELPPVTSAPTLDPSTNSGTIKASNITNSLAPLFDVTGLLPTITPPTSTSVSPYNLELFRSSNGSAPVLVGTAAPGATQVRDTSGTLVNGVYTYSVAQVDLVGNVSPLSAGTTITINTTAPAIPTLVLFASDDSGAPSHPNVTNVTSPRFNGIGTAGLPIVLYNQATGQGLAMATVSANGTYLLQIIGPVAQGTYTLVAKISNSAGNSSSSAPLTITILSQAPSVVPTLSLLPATDTGLKGDGVTANHRPTFTGTTNPGVTVTLYSLTNGVLSAPQATTTSSTVNGSFSFQLPFNLTDGTTQLVARSTDIAGNKGPLSSALNLRIISVPGDYYDTGAALLTVFNPNTETYVVQNAGSVQVDTTPGQDIPVQYDFNGDGTTDLVAYRFNAAQYFGTLMGTGSPVTTFFGQPGVALPVPGYYGGYGTFINADYNPQNAVWSIALPQPGGYVTQFGAAKIDIPVPAAYDGNGITEIATFRPVVVSGGDADSFNVDSASGGYQVSFTSPAVLAKGFVYKPGDIPAPADYDGVGHDEFAIYRPSTGQFFILNTPNPRNSATWTLRTVTLNLPGGPNANDVPASQDYQGNGKADPTVYRPSNSTFYMINSATGLQQNIAFGTPGVSVAAAGPLLYRLTALQGAFATTDGYSAGTAGLPSTFASFSSIGVGGGTVHALSIASASTSTATSATSSSAPVSTMIAVATPIPITTAVPTPTPASVVVPAPATPINTLVTVGVSTPKTTIKTSTEKAKTTHAVKTVKETADKAKKVVKPLTVETKTHEVKVKVETEKPKAKVVTTTKSTTASHQTKLAAAALALQKLVLAKKGHKKA